MDPEIPRSGDNGLGTGPLILRQLGQNSETPFPYRPLVSVMLVKLLTIWHGRNNSETNPVLSEQRPVFKEIRCRKIRVCRWICPVFKENSQHGIRIEMANTSPIRWRTARSRDRRY
jgi:hypothetical protein